jgi:hypothetical protein
MRKIGSCIVGVAWVAWGIAVLAQDAAPAAAAPATPAPATRPFTISKETTYFTAPVRADGTIDYVEAINAQLSKGVTPENNAAIPFLDAVEAGDRAMPAHYKRLRDILGAPASTLKDRVADPPQGEVDGLDFAMRGPWTAEKAPAMATWLETARPRLDRAVEASRRARYYMPLIREHEGDNVVAVLLPHLNEQRGLVNGLKARAMLALGNEDMEAFRRDVTAILRMSRLTSNGSTLVERLVAIGCEMVALDAIETAATGGWLSANDIDALVAEIRGGVPSAPIYTTFQLAERTFMLEFLQTAAVHGVPEASKMLDALGNNPRANAGAAPLPPVDPGTKDWNAALRKANAWYDRFEQAGRRPTYLERARESDQINADVIALRQKLDGWRGVFAPIEDRMLVLVLPSLNRAYLTEARMHTERVLAETTLALSSFRAKVGEYPAGLNELVPAYFKSEPTDALSGKPLIYHVEGKGYVLRSLGPDGKQSDGPKSDDRVLRAER